MLKSLVTRLFVARFFLFAFAAYGAIWTVVESISAFISDIKPSGAITYACLVGTSFLVGVWKAWPRSSIEIGIPNSDSSITIEFGNVLNKSGCIAIQVNDFFDSLLGEHIAPNSLHGQFIRNVLGGQSSSFDDLVARALSGVPYDDVDRPSGNKRRYKIGTTATIDVNDRRFLLFALTTTDLNTLKVSATIHDLWDALDGLWEAVRNKSNGSPVFMSLVGSGQSGVGLPPKTLLDLLMVSYFYYTKKQKIAGKLTVVLDPRFLGVIDLPSIQEQLE